MGLPMLTRHACLSTNKVLQTKGLLVAWDHRITRTSRRRELPRYWPRSFGAARVARVAQIPKQAALARLRRPWAEVADLPTPGSTLWPAELCLRYRIWVWDGPTASVQRNMRLAATKRSC